MIASRKGNPLLQNPRAVVSCGWLDRKKVQFTAMDRLAPVYVFYLQPISALDTMELRTRCADIRPAFADNNFERICSPPCSDERWAGWLNTADEGLRERVAMLC